MDIKEELLTKSPFTRPGTKMKDVRALVVHWIGNPDTTANQNRGYFESLAESGDRYASYHYIVDLNGDILKLVPENEICYAAGGVRYRPIARNMFYDDELGRIYPHFYTINVAVCHPDTTGEFTDESLSSLATLASDIVLRHGIDGTMVLRHYDITGKACPKYYVKNPEKWKNLVDDIMALPNGLR